MDLLNLPEEITEQIFILLPVEDLLSCCLVKSDWRNAVNKNVIWKRHCNSNLDLENLKSIVNPAFEVPKINCESLTPICEYRLKYMREIHLCNNFRNNRCVEYKLSISAELDDFEGHTEVINNYLFVNDGYKHMFHVWDIEGKPFEVQTVPYLLQEMGTHWFQAVGNCLLIVQCNLLQLYYIDEGVVSLKFCRIFDKEEQFSNNIPDVSQIPMWYSANIGWCPYGFTSWNEIVGDYFIGIIGRSHGRISVHIWDLSSGKKLKEDIIPESYDLVEKICTEKNSNCLFIALYLNSRASALGGVRCKIYSYDLKKLEYTQFYVESNHAIPFMICEEKVVVLPCDQRENSGSYTFLDALTGKKIVEKQFDTPITESLFDSNNNVLAFGSRYSVTVIDLLTQKELGFFAVDFKVKDVTLLTNNILLVGGMVYNFVLEVWDIKRNCRLYTLYERAVIMSKMTLPRLCLHSGYSFYIQHYWSGNCKQLLAIKT